MHALHTYVLQTCVHGCVGHVSEFHPMGPRPGGNIAPAVFVVLHIAVFVVHDLVMASFVILCIGVPVVVMALSDVASCGHCGHARQAFGWELSSSPVFSMLLLSCSLLV